MSITLTLTGDTSILVANYFPPIELNQHYVCGLISLDTYNSIPNVDIENNRFHIGEHIIEIPIGSYEINDISELLANEYENKEKLNKSEKVGNLIINPNYNTLQTEIISDKDIIYFNKERTIGTLLGFSSKILQPNIKHISDKAIDITKINNICVQCNIINGSYINNESAHTLHQFSLVVSPGYKITETPQNVIYLPVNTTQINSITLKVVDQNGQIINFRGERITIRLHLKPNKE